MRFFARWSSVVCNPSKGAPGRTGLCRGRFISMGKNTFVPWMSSVRTAIGGHFLGCSFWGFVVLCCLGTTNGEPRLPSRIEIKTVCVG